MHFEFGNSLDFRVAFAPIVWKISSKSFGNEFAQVVILPAPRHITRSPGSATAATCEGSSCSSLRGRTWQYLRSRIPLTKWSLSKLSIGTSPAAKTSETKTISASLKQPQNSSNKSRSRVYLCGWKTPITFPEPQANLAALRAACRSLHFHTRVPVGGARQYGLPSRYHRAIS